MRKRKRKRTGRGVLAALLLAGLAWASVLSAQGNRSPAAVIAGTVFRNTGLSLRGAEVVVAGVEKGKKKEWKTVSDPRGEFFLRVPPGPADYNVIVKASGYRTYEKAVTLATDERIDLSIIMEPESGAR